MNVTQDIKEGIIAKERLVVDINSLGLKLFGLINTFLKQHGLTEPQYNVLRILQGAYPNLVSITDISKRMLHDNSNCGALTSKLIDKGLVSVFKDSNDSRKKYHSLTIEGLAFLLEIEPKIEELCIDKIALDKTEMKRLNLLLNKIR